MNDITWYQTNLLPVLFDAVRPAAEIEETVTIHMIKASIGWVSSLTHNITLDVCDLVCCHSDHFDYGQNI